MNFRNSERGQGLIELVIALTMLSVAVAALLAALVSTAISLQRASQKGNALTLADKQLEVYRTLAYTNIRLDPNSIPTGATNTYRTAYLGDSTIPPPTGEVVGGLNGEPACTAGPTTPECTAQQTVTGPDHRTYRIDTYIIYTYPTGGLTSRQVKQVLVVVRDASKVGTPILARNGSTFDESNFATG